MVSLSNHLGGRFGRLSDRMGLGIDKTGSHLLHRADHGHGKIGRRRVRGRVMWLTPSFGDRVEHGERPLKVARGISLCAWVVKQMALVA